MSPSQGGSQSSRGGRRFYQVVPTPFDWKLLVQAHGWVSLAPNHWDDAGEVWTTALDLGGRAVDVSIRPSGSRLRVEVAGRALDDAELDRVRSTVRHMLSLDLELDEFWRLCDQSAALRWLARRGGGRLLRGASVFEDLMKILFTTNCTWAVTQGLSRRLCETLGEATPSGLRAFPDAARCAQQGEDFYVDEIRAGYRARPARELARWAAERPEELEALRDPELPTEELRRRILARPGFGPYAAGQALRLLGRFEDLALDSWCHARWARLMGGRKPTEAAIRRRFRRFGEYKGLALWFVLSSEWHGEPPVDPRRL